MVGAIGVSPKPPLMGCSAHPPSHCEYWMLMAQSSYRVNEISQAPSLGCLGN